MTDRLLRAAPSYNVYASDDLANVDYFGMTIEERGLHDSMCRAYWAQQRPLPRDPRLLSLVVRLTMADVQRWLTPAVLRHFEPDEVDQNALHPRELKRQRANILLVREKQREGGKVGANLTNQGRRKSKKNKGSEVETSTPARQPSPVAVGRGRVPKRTELKRTELKEQSLEKQKTNGDPSASAAGVGPWLAEYEAEEARKECTASEYRARRG